MLFEAKGASDFLSGAILDPETLTQKSTTSGDCFPTMLKNLGIIPGVKPHLKVYSLPGTGGDTGRTDENFLPYLSGKKSKNYYRYGAP